VLTNLDVETLTSSCWTSRRWHPRVGRRDTGVGRVAEPAEPWGLGEQASAGSRRLSTPLWSGGARPLTTAH
jgi:hypothetical protein